MPIVDPRLNRLRASAGRQRLRRRTSQRISSSRTTRPPAAGTARFTSDGPATSSRSIASSSRASRRGGRSDGAACRAPGAGACWAYVAHKLAYFMYASYPRDQVWRVDPGVGSAATQVTDTKADVAGFKISPDGARLLAWGDIPMECADFGCDAKDVKDKGALVGPGSGRLYKDGTGFVRHWDTWETPGTHSRPFVFNLADGKASAPRPVAAGLAGDTPSKPFGGGEELAWGADSRTVYFTLRKADRHEPTSTNLDIYSWLVDSRMMPVNLTEANQATDTLPTPAELDLDKITVLSMAPTIANAVREVFEDGSVTSLFEDSH